MKLKHNIRNFNLISSNHQKLMCLLARQLTQLHFTFLRKEKMKRKNEKKKRKEKTKRIKNKKEKRKGRRGRSSEARSASVARTRSVRSGDT